MKQNTIDKLYSSNAIMHEQLTNYYNNKRADKQSDEFFYGGNKHEY